jgi:hypothetical protein
LRGAAQLPHPLPLGVELIDLLVLPCGAINVGGRRLTKTIGKWRFNGGLMVV